MHRKAIVAVALSIGAASANAQSSAERAGWYGGLDLGRSRLGLSGGDFDDALSRQGIGASSVNERSDTSYGVNLGYRLNRNFALEGTYAKLGKFGYSAAASAPSADTIEGSYKAEAYSLSAVGIMPLQRNWSLYGKAGLARTRAELEGNSLAGAVSVRETSDSSFGLLVGAGATYDFSNNLFAKSGWDRYSRVGGDDTGKGPVDLYSVGLGVRF